MAITFLTVDEVLDIHRDQIARYGGSSAIRDIGLLESALAMPKVEFGGRYLHADIYEMAAAYLYHIAQNHPFVDGNKRTGIVAALVFLLMNDLEVTASEDELESLVWSVVSGKTDKSEISAFFRANTTTG